MYLDEYAGKRVYQEGLEEDEQALYRAAAAVVWTVEQVNALVFNKHAATTHGQEWLPIRARHEMQEHIIATTLTFLCRRYRM